MKTTFLCYYVQSNKVEIAYIASKTKASCEKFILSLEDVSEIISVKKIM